MLGLPDASGIVASVPLGKPAVLIQRLPWRATPTSRRSGSRGSRRKVRRRARLLSQNGYRLLGLLNGHRRCDPKAVRGNEPELHPTGELIPRPQTIQAFLGPRGPDSGPPWPDLGRSRSPARLAIDNASGWDFGRLPIGQASKCALRSAVGQPAGGL